MDEATASVDADNESCTHEALMEQEGICRNFVTARENSRAGGFFVCAPAPGKKRELRRTGKELLSKLSIL